MSKPQNPLIVTIGVVGLLIVLIFMWWYPRNTQKTAQSTPAINLNNEFDQPIVSPEAVTTEEKSAQAAFTFTVLSPETNTTVKTALITVTGKTVPQADIFVNDVDAKSDAKGNFSVSYALEEGENYIIIGANDSFGNFAEQELHIYYEP